MLIVESANIYNITYTVSNISDYKKEAIKKAVNMAKENITFAAEASGVKLDKLQSLSVDFYNNSYHPYPIYAKTAKESGSATLLYQNPGNIKVSATVRMVYSTL
jgi:uncharacterized protein YggE